MCFRCDQIDDKITHYKWLEVQIGDRATLVVIKRLIAELGEQKTALHPDRE
jgi:hypothetical protein